MHSARLRFSKSVWGVVLGARAAGRRLWTQQLVDSAAALAAAGGLGSGLGGSGGVGVFEEAHLVIGCDAAVLCGISVDSTVNPVDVDDAAVRADDPASHPAIRTANVHLGSTGILVLDHAWRIVEEQTTKGQAPLKPHSHAFHAQCTWPFWSSFCSGSKGGLAPPLPPREKVLEPHLPGPVGGLDEALDGEHGGVLGAPPELPNGALVDDGAAGGEPH